MKPLILVVFFVFTFQLILGIYSQFPTTITPDAAMHAEIVNIIREQGFIRTWEPYAPNDYSYPPLFHYLATLLTPFLLSIDAVRVLGIIIWLCFPLSLYVLVATYKKEAALTAACLGAVAPPLATVFIYGEFPQLLAMLFLIWEWYFLRCERYLLGAVFAGLIVLSHSFVPFAAIALLAYFLISSKQIKYAAATCIVALPWVPAYVLVVQNILSGAWENTRYNAVQPVFGFWPTHTIIDWLFGAHGLGILAPLAAYGVFKVRDWWVRGFFAVGLAFTLFHIPFTQLKIYDLLVLPVIVLASLGVYELSLLFKDRGGYLAAALCVFLFLGLVQVQHFENARVNWFNPEIAPTAELADAARWLAVYDPRPVKIYAHSASAWVGILSLKLPLDPDIAHIEAFSKAYREQLDMQAAIKMVLSAGSDSRLVSGVSYLIVPVSVDVMLPPIYRNDKWAVYRSA